MMTKENNNEKDTSKNKDSEKSPLKDYLKYSGLAIQMGITIGLATWAGVSLDEYFGFEKIPVMTLVLSLSAIFGSLFSLIRGLTK